MFVIKDKTNNKFLYEKNLLPKLENSVTQTEAGKKALDAHQGKVLKDLIDSANGDIAEKLDANLGAENSGKYLTVAENGNVSPAELALKTINNQSIIGSGNISIDNEESVDLLFTTTLTESVAKVYLGEDNYNFFSKYKKFYIYSYVLANTTATNNGYIRVEFKRTNLGTGTIPILTNGTQNNQPVYRQYNTYYLHICDYKHPFLQTSRYTNNYNSNMYPSNVVGSVANVADFTIGLSECNYLCFYCQGDSVYNGFPAGSVFAIYGVK